MSPSPPEPSQEIIAGWRAEQERLRSRLVTHNVQDWQRSQQLDGLNYVGGVDLSFMVGDDVNACAAYVVCSVDDDLEVVYEDLQMVKLTAPYVPGYLAFRETKPLLQLIERQQQREAEVTPQVVLVDGNGVLHPHRFGLACHLGVKADTPTIGVAKNLFQMNDEGLMRDSEHKKKIQELSKVGDSFELSMSSDGSVLGAAVKSSADSSKPVFVSVGHQIDLKTALGVVLRCSRYRVPEPIRQADIRSREYLRKHFPPTTGQET